MDDISLRALAQLEPEGLDAEGQSWQQRKSVQTRITILEAAIDCLQKHGYGRTTTQLIAEMAGISRGAMLHHYATKQDLIASVIDYTVYKRMEHFLEGIRALKDSARINEMAGMEISWQSMLGREFAAYLELAIAARTDADLAAIFLPKARRFDKTELAEVIRAFPEWADDPGGYALAMDYVHAALEGMVINRDIWAQADQRALCKFVGRTIAMLRRGDLRPPE
ncbi:MAG: TetR/AcrR family transcriptional regulator [Caulobacteraceae bacterium]|nr:TetR/AcrR family transcriptional regulator [Caulobacteraceae bacterium]